MSRTVNVQGTLVPLWVNDTAELGYRHLRNNWSYKPNRTRLRLYTKDPAKAEKGELCDASMTENGVIEAGYCVEKGLSDFDWFESTANTPTA